MLAGGGNQAMTMAIYLVFFVGIMYFLVIRPSNKEKKKQQDLMNSLAIGDGVLTTAGFYGVIIDMTADTVIVEFGNNKNCRIPMQKASIVKNEKPTLQQDKNNTTVSKKEIVKEDKKA